MLARTPATLVYLSAEELGITAAERAGLIEVRDDLASGRVKHARRTGYFGNNGLKADALGFNMNQWSADSDCGTAHCIGGFMNARGVINRHTYNLALRPLFYPVGGYSVGEWDGFTPAQAVRAIDLFLSGAGPHCWPLALSDEEDDAL